MEFCDISDPGSFRLVADNEEDSLHRLRCLLKLQLYSPYLTQHIGREAKEEMCPLLKGNF